jgi:hypothetical protein
MIPRFLNKIRNAAMKVMEVRTTSSNPKAANNPSSSFFSGGRKKIVPNSISAQSSKLMEDECANFGGNSGPAGDSSRLSPKIVVGTGIAIVCGMTLQMYPNEPYKKILDLRQLSNLVASVGNFAATPAANSVGTKNKRVLVVGAGPAGLSMLRSFKSDSTHKCDVVCYEKQDDSGGQWYFSKLKKSGRDQVGVR